MNTPPPTLENSVNCVLTAWRAHGEELRGFLVRRSGDLHTADDLLQELFLKSLRQGTGFCKIDNPRAWLFQVARHALIDHVRLAKPHIELADDLVAPEETERAPVEALDACLLLNLSEMSAEDHEIIKQCDLLGVKQQAFADQHSLTLTATKSRLLRARQRLREALMRNCQVRFDEIGQVCCHIPRDPPP